MSKERNPSTQVRALYLYSYSYPEPGPGAESTGPGSGGRRMSDQADNLRQLVRAQARLAGAAAGAILPRRSRGLSPGGTRWSSGRSLGRGTRQGSGRRASWSSPSGPSAGSFGRTGSLKRRSLAVAGQPCQRHRARSSPGRLEDDRHGTVRASEAGRGSLRKTRERERRGGMKVAIFGFR